MFEKSTSDARPEDKIHPCAAGSHCRTQAVIAGTRRPALTDHHNTLCDGCRAYYTNAIRRLAKDFAMLTASLGEHHTRQGDIVKASRSIGIPIDSTSDRLMTEIVEWADCAAAIIANALNTDQPDGRRKLAAQIRLDDGTTHQLNPGSLADRSFEHTQPCEADRLAAYLAIIEPHLDDLAAEPRQDVQIWAQPKRCEQHAAQIATAKRMLDLARKITDTDEIAEATTRLQAAYAAAGVCNTCCGWSQDGRHQAHQQVELSGLDILGRLTRLHHLTREHLGHTRLRIKYSLPCPAVDKDGNVCGSDELGKDDGAAVVDCRACGASWTEREYKWLAGMIADDAKTLGATKYLLAEAYWRLDILADAADIIRESPDLALNPNAARVVLDLIDTALKAHPKPAERRTATDKAAAKLRQVDEDNWAWKREKTYKKPKPRKKAAPYDGPRIHPDSLTTDLIDPTPSRHPVCGDCHLEHPEGECP